MSADTATIKRIQQKVGVAADGIIGPKTLAAISAALGIPRSFAASPTIPALMMAFFDWAIVAMIAFVMRATASTEVGDASFARSARTWKDMIDSALSRSFWKSSAGCFLKYESGSSPSGRDTTLTGISAARKSPAVRIVALCPAASSSKTSTACVPLEANRCS